MKRTTHLVSVAAVAALALSMLPRSAQVERASIIGNVTDKTGAALAGVTVTITNEATNTTTKVLTSDAGAYTAVNLIPGSYTISAAKSGFVPITYRNFVVQVSQ